MVEGLRDERFLILTNPEDTQGVVLRATDADGYLDAMARRWSAAGGTATGTEAGADR